MKGLRNLITYYRISISYLLIIFILLTIPFISKSQDMQFFSNLELYGGQINDIAILPSDPNRIFIGTYLGDGLYMSNDCGDKWQAIETYGKNPNVDDFKNQTVFAISIAPSNPQVIWATHDTYVEKSTDGGQSWTHISHSAMQSDCNNCGGAGDDLRLCHAIVIDPSDPNTVYIGTSGPGETYVSGAVYKTTNGGANWTKMFDGNDFDFAVWDMDIDPQDNEILWVVTNNFATKEEFGGTLYRSGDGGETWTPIFSGTPYGSPYLSVAVKPNDSNTVFAGSCLGVETHFFDGNNWVTPFAFPSWWVDDSLFVEDIVFDPQNPEILYATWLNPLWGDGIGKVGRSIDGGLTWGEIYTHDFDFISLAVHPSDPNIIFAGERTKGLFRSNDHGQTWTPVNNGISAVVIYDVEVDPNDSTHILVGAISGVYEKKGQQAWTELLGYTARSILFDPMDSSIIYAGMEGFLAKSIDGGITWSFVDILAGPGDGSQFNFVSDIAIDFTDTNTIFIAVNEFDNIGEIQKSTDGGASFTKVLEDTNNDSENYRFNVVRIDPSHGEHIFAGGGNFLPPKIHGDLWESLDGGNTWHRTGLQGVIVNSILIHPTDPNILYAGTGYSTGTEVPLYKSTDGGVTWAPSFDGIPVGSDVLFNTVTDLAFHPQDLNVVYAGTRGQGIFISPNHAEKWLKLGTPEYFVNAIAVSSLYGATEGGLLQLTGTGCLYGQVYDANSQASIDANIITGFCVGAKSSGGEFMMVSFAGNFSVTAITDGYANSTHEDVTLYGGDAVRLDFPMLSGIPGPTPCSERKIYLKENKYCFIATAAYGSTLDK